MRKTPYYSYKKVFSFRKIFTQDKIFFFFFTLMFETLFQQKN